MYMRTVEEKEFHVLRFMLNVYELFVLLVVYYSHDLQVVQFQHMVDLLYHATLM